MHMKILADSMGLGKTIMTLSLLLTHSRRGGLPGSHSTYQLPSESAEVSNVFEQSMYQSEEATKFLGFNKLVTQRNLFVNGGSLIVCPMTLLGQWKVEIYHVKFLLYLRVWFMYKHLCNMIILGLVITITI